MIILNNTMITNNIKYYVSECHW